MFYPQSLKTAIILLVLVPLLTILAAVGLLGLREFEQQMETRMQEDLERVARLVRLPVSTAMLRGDVEDVQQALDSVFELEHVIGVYVYAADGELVANSGARSPLLERRREARKITEEGTQGAYADRHGQEIFSVFLPLSDPAGRIVGLLQMTRDVSHLRAYVQMRYWQGAAAIFLLGLALLLMVLLGHYYAVGRHVQRLAQAMGRVGAGERGLSVPVQGPGELRELAIAMNTMIRGRETSEQALVMQQRQKIELEERLRQAEKLAAIGRLAAGVAHQLGTPLGVIAGRVQRARRRLESDSPAVRELDLLATELHRIEHIVRQLLNYARRNPLQYRSIQLAPWLADIAGRVQFSHANATLRLELMPLDSAPDHLCADPNRLEQAIGNLLTNALQAARDCVSLQWGTQTPNHLFIQVTDDGPGLGQADHERLFEPFYTTKASGEGTGLGLAIAHAAIMEHGGDLTLMDATTTTGTGFRVILPLQPANQEVAACQPMN